MTSSSEVMCRKKWIPPGLSIEILRYITFSRRTILFRGVEKSFFQVNSRDCWDFFFSINFDQCICICIYLNLFVIIKKNFFTKLIWYRCDVKNRSKLITVFFRCLKMLDTNLNRILMWDKNLFKSLQIHSFFLRYSLRMLNANMNFFLKYGLFCYFWPKFFVKIQFKFVSIIIKYLKNSINLIWQIFHITSVSN